MKMIKQNVHTWHGKETHFTLLREISGLPTKVVTTMASQKQVLYCLLHSCGKYVNKQVTDEGSIERDRKSGRGRGRERDILHV
jgi:hypothetical protein